MALEARLVQKLNQQLLITPQLQQAIKLLQLGRMEYLEAIEEQLLDNPLLEEVRESSQESEGESPSFDGNEGDSSSEDSLNTEILTVDNVAMDRDEMQSILDSLSDWRGAAQSKGQLDEDRPEPESYLSKEESLNDVLLQQLRFCDLDERDTTIAFHIIGNLDRRGYLACTVSEIAEECKESEERVEEILRVIQGFEPLGVAARNLRECLLIQLTELGYENTLAHRIIRDHIDKLETKKYEVIIEAEGTNREALMKALETIRSLEPFPARNYTDEAARTVTPDVYVKKIGNEYVVTLNEDGLPRLRVNQNYLDILKNGEQLSSTAGSDDQKVYLQDRLKAATWLIKSDLQRRQTILKVASAIVEFQKEFLEHGISKMKPLVLRNVAEQIGMHESTVSRVTSNKYIDTPQGIFELKFFFSTGIKAGGGDVSSSAVKERIKALIDGEDPNKPISDQDICELLKKENITIARRTVAKYRESLGIESSSLRKRSL